MKILGLDIGKVRVGIAISDETLFIAEGLTTVKRTPASDFLSSLREIINAHQVEKIIVGLPVNMNGSLGPQAQGVLSLASELEKQFGLPVITWDERLTTVAAEKILIKADVTRRKRKKVVDKLAATLILQGYLDSLRFDQNKQELVHE